MENITHRAMQQEVGRVERRKRVVFTACSCVTCARDLHGFGRLGSCGILLRTSGRRLQSVSGDGLPVDLAGGGGGQRSHWMDAPGDRRGG